MNKESYQSHCRLELLRLYALGKKLGLIKRATNQNFKDYTTNLWSDICAHPELKNRAICLEQSLSKGDTLKLLRNVVANKELLD